MGLSTTLCVLLAAAAVACAVPGPRSATGSVAWRRVGLAVLGVTVAVTIWWLVDRPRELVLAAMATGAAAVVLRMVVRHRADRAAARERERVIEMCDALQAELAAGQPPIDAFGRAAGDWPLVGPVARLAAAGGDVPTALREAAETDGAGDLRTLAAAWQVAHRTGYGLADAVARVAAELRAAEQTRRIVTGELASARATARLVAVLPVAALAMGSGAGADPWSFLFRHPVGLACLAGGLGFGLAGLAWIEGIARDVERGR